MSQDQQEIQSIEENEKETTVSTEGRSLSEYEEFVKKNSEKREGKKKGKKYQQVEAVLGGVDIVTKKKSKLKKHQKNRSNEKGEEDEDDSKRPKGGSTFHQNRQMEEPESPIAHHREEIPNAIIVTIIEAEIVEEDLSKLFPDIIFGEVIKGDNYFIVGLQNQTDRQKCLTVNRTKYNGNPVLVGVYSVEHEHPVPPLDDRYGYNNYNRYGDDYDTSSSFLKFGTSEQPRNVQPPPPAQSYGGGYSDDRSYNRSYGSGGSGFGGLSFGSHIQQQPQPQQPIPRSSYNSSTFRQSSDQKFVFGTRKQDSLRQ